jgi:hemoglobin
MQKKKLFVLSLLLLTSCAAQGKRPIDPNASLYERLGGLAAIEAVVEDFYANVASDERINGFFIGADAKLVNRLLSEQICQVSGGPCKYSGRDMITVHTGMNITEAQFNALVEDLIRSLNKFNVGAQEQNELIKALGSMKGDIVDR